MTVNTIKVEMIKEKFRLTLVEITDLLGVKKYRLQTEKYDKVINVQDLETLDVALAIFDGMVSFYEILEG